MSQSPKADILLNRLISARVPFAANDSIAEHLSAEDIAAIEGEVAERFENVLDALLIQRDHNTQGTAKRVAKMYVREIFAGRYEKRPAMTDFPNARNLDELYTVGPIAVRSTCSHHFCPIEGEAWCGVVPGDKVIGLSKFTRLSRWVLARPQIQEEAVVQLADELEDLIKPRALAVVIRSRHSCMTLRGVMEHETSMTTSVMRGLFKTDAKARAEFLATIAGQGFSCR
ncbi:GTP cyclohydrolase I [Parvibaculum sp.]|uniref:GTP cyclohydrolase I n=1 Tax=Parvibaculum sp. TaxID=2024848 RepID=UPI001DC3F606|nr:GTP cyclohydrolase I [Parvibaculum sp.]MBX3490888.1 GTP cyclohydrolase I [Parvibaculum sp.]